MKVIRTVAPAKVNLFLGIGPRREDGFHDATSVMHALALHDRLSFTFGTADDPDAETVVTTHTEWAEGLPETAIDSDDNLVTKAVTALAARLGRRGDVVDVAIEKHIPAGAGLGGGSSDAAAALVAAAEAWNCDVADAIVGETATELGVDVAFFLRGACGIYGGRGDVFDRALDAANRPIVVAWPGTGVSTPEAFAAFDRHPVPVDAALLERVDAAGRADDVPLFDNLTEAACGLNAGIADVIDVLAGDGVEAVAMSGSGSAVFALCSTHAAASAASVRVRAAGYWARTTALSSLRAAVLPN